MWGESRIAAASVIEIRLVAAVNFLQFFWLVAAR